MDHLGEILHRRGMMMIFVFFFFIYFTYQKKMTSLFFVFVLFWLSEHIHFGKIAIILSALHALLFDSLFNLGDCLYVIFFVCWHADVAGSLKSENVCLLIFHDMQHT